jgi:Tol biopolymer transport system component
MRNVRTLLAILLLTAAVLACASPLALTQPAQVDQSATFVAQTLQAVMPFASPVPQAVASPSPLPSPSPSQLLPHSLYFLNNDKTGLLQVFRLERDGKTARQITFEPAAVDSFAVSLKDGSVAYVSNNQLLLVDVNGAGRRVLVDGGNPPPEDNFTKRVGSPVWSPDGAAIAFSLDGLNFYALNTGAVSKVLENQIDRSQGFPMVRELYAPNAYSPDGSKLLINIGYYEAGTFGIYYPSGNTLVRFSRPDGNLVCCDVRWVPDSSGLYVAAPTMGMFDSGLWYADASNGNVATLLPGSAPDGTYNFADAPQVGPDGKLYFFFNNLKEIPSSGHTPLYMVRSASDGVTGRTELQPTLFENVNEVLWAPDASLAVVAYAPTQDVYGGGQAVLEYPDGRPSVLLTDFAMQMKWGP